jgi:hypothetical protein
LMWIVMQWPAPVVTMFNTSSAAAFNLQLAVSPKEVESLTPYAIEWNY